MKYDRLYRIHEDSDPRLLLNFKSKDNYLVSYGKERVNNSFEVVPIGGQMPVAWIHIAVFEVTDNLLGHINAAIDYLVQNRLYDYAYLRYEGEIIRVHKLSPEVRSFFKMKKYFYIRKTKNSTFWSNV